MRRIIGVVTVGLLWAVSPAVWADSLSVVGAKLTQSYNEQYQQQLYQKDVQHNDQIEQERLAVVRKNAETAKSPNDGSARDDSDYRVLPSRCERTDAVGEFSCYVGNDNYYQVTRVADGYRWTGSNAVKKTSWSGVLTQQGVNVVYSGLDAAGKAFRKVCSATACF